MARSILVAMSAISVAAPPFAKAQDKERGVITIIVTDTHDEAIANARLTVRGSDVETTLGADREVKIGTQRDGTQLLRVAAEGYLPTTFSIHLADDRRYQLHVQLESPTPARAKRDARPRPRRVWMVPEGQEPTKLLLGDGEIVDDSLLVAWQPGTFGDFLRHVFGVDARVVRAGRTIAHGRPTKGGSLCPVSMFLDGNHPISPTALETLYSSQDLELVEVFRVGTGVPTAYRRGESLCGALIFWTRIRS